MMREWRYVILIKHINCFQWKNSITLIGCFSHSTVANLLSVCVTTVCSLNYMVAHDATLPLSTSHCAVQVKGKTVILSLQDIE